MTITLKFDKYKTQFTHVLAICELGNFIQIIGDDGQHVEYEKRLIVSIDIYTENI